MFYAISSCATPERGGGIHVFSLSATGKLLPHCVFPCDRPMYTAKEQNIIHILLRDSGSGESAVVSASVENGILQAPTAPVSTNGIVACHLSADAGDIYAVNYLSGNVTRIGGKTVTFERKGPHLKRQDMSHTHCVILSPDKNYVLVTDLGGDAITVFDRNLSFVSESFVPAGNGARHLVFSHDGKLLYCVNELSATVSVFEWHEGNLTYLHDFSSEVSAECLPENTAAAIRLSGDGKRLYISNRGEDTLVAFETEDRVHFSLSQKVCCGGKGPRDFILTDDERYLICTNERSDSVTVFALEERCIGDMTDSISLSAPLCVMPL